jgi:hypothetical protein
MMGDAALATKAESEEYLEAKATPSQMRQKIRAARGLRPIRTPMKVATPLPPLN